MTFPHEPHDTLTERLLGIRTVLVSGPIEPDGATRAAAMLLTLDAESQQPVTVRLNSSGGDLGAALMLADSVDLMRSPVHLTCLGEVGGAALAVVTAAAHRTASPGCRFHLVEPRMTSAEGTARTAGELAQLADAHDAAVERLAWRIAQLTHRSPADVRADLAPPGLVLDAAAAVEYGLVEAPDAA